MINKTKLKFYSGTSGLALTVPKRLFPPAFQNKTRLDYYASLFNSIEINSSFYKVPMASTVSKWSDSVPQGFQFTFKLCKTITHNKGLDFNPDDIPNFINIINGVNDKKGCLLLQFPPSLSITFENQFQKLLKFIRRADPGQHWKTVVEFRNRSWYQPEIYDKLLQYNIGLVHHDHPSSATPLVNLPANVAYIRFHGPNGGYRGSYTDDFLYDNSLQIHSLLKAGKTVYVYFNNTMGDAAKNLTMLNELVGV